MVVAFPEVRAFQAVARQAVVLRAALKAVPKAARLAAVCPVVAHPVVLRAAPKAAHPAVHLAVPKAVHPVAPRAVQQAEVPREAAALVRQRAIFWSVARTAVLVAQAALVDRTVRTAVLPVADLAAVPVVMNPVTLDNSRAAARAQKNSAMNWTSPSATLMKLLAKNNARSRLLVVTLRDLVTARAVVVVQSVSVSRNQAAPKAVAALAVPAAAAVVAQPAAKKVRRVHWMV